jgi:hypothetical protein
MNLRAADFVPDRDLVGAAGVALHLVREGPLHPTHFIV